MMLPPSSRLEASFVYCVLYKHGRRVYSVARVFTVLDVLHRRQKARGRWVTMMPVVMLWCHDVVMPLPAAGLEAYVGLSKYLVDPLL